MDSAPVPPLRRFKIRQIFRRARLFPAFNARDVQPRGCNSAAQANFYDRNGIQPNEVDSLTVQLGANKIY